MKTSLNNFLIWLYKFFLQVPLLKRHSSRWYRLLGVSGDKFRISPNITVVGDFSNLSMGANSEINAGCFLLAKDKIIIGANSTLAYKVTILTSANPNGPHNILAKLYPAMTKPVTIGEDCWIGANALILPGIRIGRRSVIAAGAVVTKDVSENTVVAGVPAKEISKISILD